MSLMIILEVNESNIYELKEISIKKELLMELISQQKNNKCETITLYDSKTKKRTRKK